jgi:hypothetical protein
MAFSNKKISFIQYGTDIPRDKTKYFRPVRIQTSLIRSRNMEHEARNALKIQMNVKFPPPNPYISFQQNF